MANLTSVTVTAGVPTVGTGTVSTIDALMADGGQATLGTTTGAAVVTDATGTLQQYLRGLVKLLAANITVLLSDGTNTAAVKAASTAPLATDPAIVVAISPNSVNANGTAADASSAPVAFSTEGKAQLGSLTETAPATDTASSGLNGRLQRIAQRLTSLISLVPTALGAGVKAGALLTTIATDQATLSIAADTSQIANGVSGTFLTPTKVKISVASATTTTLVALVSSKKIRILAMYLISTGANTINFQSHTTTSNSDGLMGFVANTGMVLPFNPLGWFDTTAGEALDMVTSGAGQVSGQLSYVAV